MTIRHTINDADRILLITLSGDVGGQAFSAFVCDLYGRRPELFEYRCITDMLDYRGELGNADLTALQALYAAGRRSDGGLIASIILTRDPHFHFWATALDAQFPGRRHTLASSLEEALTRLGDLQLTQPARSAD
jgi:hypothetical protein